LLFRFQTLGANISFPVETQCRLIFPPLISKTLNPPHLLYTEADATPSVQPSTAPQKPPCSCLQRITNGRDAFATVAMLTGAFKLGQRVNVKTTMRPRHLDFVVLVINNE
jgi:hypothetical protein